MGGGAGGGVGGGAGGGAGGGSVTVVANTLSLGGEHICGIASTGKAWCWGKNIDGQLGITPSNSSATPVEADGGLTFSSIVCGGGHTCGLTADGTAYCWGLLGSGQLGNSDAGRGGPSVPVANGALKFTMLSTGESSNTTCGLTGQGNVYCWGENYGGQLGNGSFDTNSHVTPSLVGDGGLVFTAVSSGGRHACGLSGGHAYCWGVDATGTSTCFGGLACFTAPAPVPGGMTFTSLNARGQSHACALTSTGAAYCWGDNGGAMLGTGSTAAGNQATPLPVDGGYLYTEVELSNGEACGHTAAGAAFCWGGQDTWGQVGLGTTMAVVNGAASPQTVVGGHAFSVLTKGRNSTCGLDSAGAAWCWGRNNFGQAGGGIDDGAASTVRHSTPGAVIGGLTFKIQ